MLVRLTNQPQYLRYLQSVDVRIPSKQLTALNQALDGHPLQIIPNPCKQSQPHISDELLPLSIYVVAKYLEDGNSGRTSLILMEQFATTHSPRLIDILSKQELPCQIFSLSFLRNLQDSLRSPQATNSSIALSFLIELFTAVCESQLQSTFKKDKSNRWVYQALLFATSYQYIRQNQVDKDGAVERAIRAVSALVNNSENEKDFELLRELISVVSLMSIFNGCKAKNVQILDILNADQVQFIQKEEITESINHWTSNRYIEALKIYLKLDPQYLADLERILRKLLMTEVSSPMLINHFQALILLIRERTSNSLHIREVTSRLLLIENQKNIKTIDKVCKLLLNSNADLLQTDAQQFNLLLAARGGNERKQCFLEAYYELYRLNNRLLPIVINYIFETALELNVLLQDFGVFVTKEACILTDDAIWKLHQLIRRTRQARLLSYLGIIVEYRRREAFSIDEEEFPLIRPEWAQQIASRPEALQIYMEIICRVVTDRSLEVHPALINLSSLVVRVCFPQPSQIQGDAFARGRQYYHLLLATAIRQRVYHEELLRYFVLAETIFGVGNSKNMDYFSSQLEKVTDQLNFLTFLEYLVTLLKSSSSVIMYLEALLCFQRASPESFRAKSLFQLSFLKRLIQQSNYFRIQTYSPAAVVLLYELSLIFSDTIPEESEKIMEGDVQFIMQAWSGLMNRSTCRNVCYFFCFRQIRKIYPYLHQKQLKNPRKRLFRSWDLILTLLDQTAKSGEYLNSKCVITAEWKAEQLHKRTLSIEGNWMRNSNMTLSWQLKIFTTSKEYELLLMNDRLIYSIYAHNKDRQIKEFPIRKLSKNPELVNFNCQIDNVSKGKSMVALYLMGITQMVHDNSLQIDGSILKIHIKCHSQALLKDLLIKDTNACKQIRPKQHLNNLHKWEIRLSSLTSIKENSFIQKFDFEQALCQLGEMLQNFKHIDLSSTYDMFLELANRMMHSQLKFFSSQLRTMNTVFSLLASALGRLKQQLNLQPSLPDPPLDASSYFHLLTSALLPESFWKHFTMQAKVRIVQITKICLNKESFRRIQNQTTEFFELVCNLVGGSAQQPLLAPLLTQCIQLHHPNELLSLKFHHFIVKSHESQSQLIKEELGRMLIKLTGYLNLQNEKFVKERILCKFLIPENKALKAVFSACPPKAKIAVLHFFANGNPINRTSPQFIGLVSPLMALMKAEESQSIVCWLVTELKQLVSPNNRGLTSMSPRSRSALNLPAMSIYLNVLVRNLINVDKQCQQISLEVIYQVLQWLLKCRKPNLSYDQQKLLTSEDYIQFLVRIAQKQLNSLNQYEKNVLQLTFHIVSIFSKPSLLSFMIGWRRNAADFSHALLFPFKQLPPSKLPIYGISIFLQYVYEVLLLVQDSILHFQKTESNALILACSVYFMDVFKQCQSSRLPRCQLYAFPRQFSEKEAPSDEKISIRLRQLDRQVLVQMRGGIYFKLAVILMKFIEQSPEINRADSLEKLILCMCDDDKPRQNQPPSQSRGPYQAKIISAFAQHKEYCQKEDVPLHLSPYSQDSEADLTPFITDYLLMSIADFIQNKLDELPESLVKAYSGLIIKAFQHYPKLYKQVNEEKVFSEWKLHYYIQLIGLRQKRDSSLSPSSPPRTQKATSPSPSESSSFHSFDNFFYSGGINSPTKRPRKKTSDGTTSQGKLKSELLQAIRVNSTNWHKYKDVKFAFFFSQKAKELRLIELLHMHWVLSRPQRRSTVHVISPEDELAKIHNETMKLYQSKYRQRLGRIDQCLRRVRKIYPYTSSQYTVLKISENCLPNMSCPITIRVPVKDYKTKNKISVNGDFFITNDEMIPYEFSEQENQTWSEPINCTVDQQDLIESEQMIVGSKYCEWVTRQGVYFCEWELNQQGLRLKSRDSRPDPKDVAPLKQSSTAFLKFQKKLDPYWYLLLGAPTSNIIKTSGVQLLLSFDEVEQVFSRKFNQVSNSALEFFMKDGTAKFIAFYTFKLQSAFVKQLEKLRKNTRRLRIYRDPIKQFENLGYRQKWTEGSISNFDYIMLINKFAGRSYNDLNQYYVFPWVLCDYTSSKLDLTDPAVFRDLSRPVGAVNPQKLKRYIQKYRNDQGNEKCLYGSHYSTSLFVFYFLVRLEPYSSLHRDMQRGQFDVADRLFSSVAQVWQNLMSESSTSDIKQSMPEFYYMFAFLRNMGHIDLGNKQCGEEVGDVELPPWAATPQEFIVTLRAALESDLVSEKLHLWIDLIFGKHQYSQERYSIFHPYSYSDCFDFQEIAKKSLLSLEGIICQISYFGQCPIQLFKKDHPQKKYQPEHQQRKISKTSIRRTPSTSSQASFSDKTLPEGCRLVKLYVEGYTFYLQVEKNESQKEWLMIPALNDFESNREIFEKCDTPRKESPKSIKVKIQPQRTELRAGKQLLLELEVDWDFKRVETNEMWIACIGVRGIRIYNWQLELCWQWEQEEVVDIYLEQTRLIFATPTGKVCFYSFFNQKLQETQPFSGISDMQMKVLMLPRLPFAGEQKRNLTQYRILCVADGRIVSVMLHSFEEIYNHTSS